MTDQLIALLGGQIVGRIHHIKQKSKLIFTYEQAWRQSNDAFPISLSMPLNNSEYGPDVVDAFLWGLLPDNEQVLDRWARKFHVSARNVFALMGHVGEDCAGAAQFVAPERLEALQSGAEDGIEWLDEASIAQRLNTLREDHAAWRLPSDTGQFSLAGAQPKTALLLQNHKWGIPCGRTPTTHILKPPTGHFDGHAENEHICLTIARALGFPTAKSSVMRFKGETAIAIERYDRLQHGNQIIRVHQEDVCQALGIMPTQKYQNEGGPSIAQIIDLLRSYSSKFEEDIQTFVDAIGFNWLIAGTDAHAKNYSLLLSGNSRVRLAPLYDIASVLAYNEFDMRKIKLSMKVGGEYLLSEIGVRQWRKLAREISLDSDELIARLRTMVARLPDEAKSACALAEKEGLRGKKIDRLLANMVSRAKQCSRLLAD